MKLISEATINIARSAVFVKKYEAEKQLEVSMHLVETLGEDFVKKTLILQEIAYWQGELSRHSAALSELRFA